MSHFGITTIPERQKIELINYAQKMCNSSIMINEEIVFTGSVSNHKSFVKHIGFLREPFCRINWKARFKDSFDVNILTPDKCLIKYYSKKITSIAGVDDFKKWLSERREEKIAELDGSITPLKKHVISDKFQIKEFTAAKLRGLYGCGLIPYLDLKQWSLIKNFQIRHHVYEDSVKPVPSMDSASSNIGMITIPKDENILAIIEVMWNQIQMEEELNQL